jgi:hypothetical protein
LDTMATSLRGAVDEPAKPDGLLGWTKQLPYGWRIDEHTLEAGVAEYRGWSLMSGQFWATSQPDQGRESFFRSRDVIAVADTDEWNDKGHPSNEGQRMDSTLLSPWLAVSGGQRVTVAFNSHYRQVSRSSDPQKAQLVLRYDDGTRQVLWNRDAAAGDQFEISKAESLSAVVPDTAHYVRAGWRLYDAANNFYWAIDDPQLSTG